MTKKTETKLADLRNVQVETLRPHSNSFGDKFVKNTGDQYIHPRPAGDIAGGVVKLADGSAAKTSPSKAG